MAQELGYLEAVIGADITQFRRGMRDVRNEMGVLSETMSGVAGLGRTLTYTLTAPLLAFGSLAVKTAGDFDNSMRNINAIAQLPEAEFQALSDRVLAFGKNTRSGAQEASEALYAVYSAGLAGEDAFTTMNWSVKTAEAGLANLTTTTEALIAVQLSYGDTTEAMSERTSNALTAMVQLGVGNMEDFAGSIARVVPAASALDVGIEELFGDIAYLTQQGLSASTASTSLNAALTALAKPTEAMSAAFAELGVTGIEDLIDKSGGLNGALKALMGTTDGTQASMRALFSTTQGARAINALFNNVGQWDSMMDDFNNSLDGATLDAWSQQMMSFGATWDRLTSAVQAAGITIGQAIIPVITPLMDGLTKLVLGFTELPPEVIQTGVAVAAFVAAAAPLLWLFGGLAAAFSPVTLALVAFGAVAASNWSFIEETFGGAIGRINEMLQPFGDMITALFQDSFPNTMTIPEPEIVPAVIDLKDTITVTSSKSLWQIFTENGYQDYFSWDEFMKRAKEGGWDGGAIDVGESFTIDMSDVRTIPPPSPLVTITGDAVTVDDADITTKVTEGFTSTIDTLKTNLEPLWDVLNFDVVSAGFQDLLDGIGSFAESMADADWSGLVVLGGALLFLGNSIIGGAASALGVAISAIGDGIGAFADGLSALVRGDFETALTDFGQGILNLFYTLATAPLAVVQSVLNVLFGLFNLEVPDFTGWINDTREALNNAIDDWQAERATMPVTATATYDTAAFESSVFDVFRDTSTQFGELVKSNENMMMGGGGIQATIPADIQWTPSAVQTVLDMKAISENMDLTQAERDVATGILNAWKSQLTPDEQATFNQIVSDSFTGTQLVVTPDGWTVSIDEQGQMAVVSDPTGLALEVTEPVTTNVDNVIANIRAWSLGTTPETPIAPTETTAPIAVDVPVATIATNFTEQFAQGSTADDIIQTYFVPLETKWNEMFAADGLMSTNFAAFITTFTTGTTSIDTDVLKTVESLEVLNTSGTASIIGFTTASNGAIGHFIGQMGFAKLAIDKVRDGLQSLLNMDSALDVQVTVSGGAVDGSHAGGLGSVPYDGYVAELHKGERVLTADEADRYNQIPMGEMMNAGTTQTNNQTNYVTINAQSFDDIMREVARRGIKFT